MPSPLEPPAAQADLQAWDLTGRQLCDLELLMTGAFAPLASFLGRADYDSVVTRMRLHGGAFWPMPITLDVTREFADTLAIGARIALRDAEGLPLATLTLREMWEPDRSIEAQALYGALDRSLPAVRQSLDPARPIYLAGELQPSAPPAHYDFQHLRLTPLQTRTRFAQSGWQRVMAAPLAGLPLVADVEAMLQAARAVDAHVLMQPVVGQAALRYLAPGDLEHYARLRCYEHVLKRCPPESTMLALLPLSSRAAGARETLWRALVHKNYGCTHVLLTQGEPSERAKLAPHAREAGIEFVEAPAHQEAPSQTRLRASLERGERIAPSILYPEVAAELRKRYRPKLQRGFTLFFTGLSGSGKSTIARALLAKLMELGTRTVTLLDGDLVRKHLSSELGFSREHRNINIQRIGYVASEITKHGGIAICAPIAPYAEMRRAVRAMISEYGGFYEIYVSTPLAVCEARDRKGLYAKARAGIIKEFTGVSDPYEAPQRAEVVIDTQHTPAAAAVGLILERLKADGYLPAPAGELDYSI
jgi:sulfate adenylyltransferase